MTTSSVSMINLMVFIGLISITVIFGRSYCGWCCPGGFIFELSCLLRIKLHKLKKLPEIPEYIHNKLIYLKHAILIISLTMIYIMTVYFGQYIPELGWVEMTILTIMALIPFSILSFFIPRAVCRYLCPISSFLGILSIKSLFKLKLNEKCVSCKLCEKKCPIQIKLIKNIDQKECIRCFDGVSVCKKYGIDYNTR
ncbi:MAG: 4Fe-4S binding protein [Methanosarcinaceae archaeon]|nr:4Fe-4S binding protein [Methanosarcinaceae archaeon]